MKFKVRQGVFETNSSSMHSICILNDCNLNNKINYEEKNTSYFYLNVEGFHRHPFKMLFSPEEKLAYCLCAFHSGIYNVNSEKFKKLENKYLKMIQAYYPNVKKWSLFNEKDYKLLYHTENGKEYDIDDEEKIGYNEDYNFYYIIETGEKLFPNEKLTEFLTIGWNENDSSFLKDFFKEAGITEEEFIFSPEYFIVVDGDEYCIFHNMMESGIICNIKAEYCEYIEHNFGSYKLLD